MLSSPRIQDGFERSQVVQHADRSQEIESQIVNMLDGSRGVEMLLSYLYTLNSSTSCEQVIDAALLYRLGDKYNLSSPRDTGQNALLDFIRNIPANWNYTRQIALAREGWIVFMELSWDWNVDGAQETRDAILDALVQL